MSNSSTMETQELDWRPTRGMLFCALILAFLTTFVMWRYFRHYPNYHDIGAYIFQADCLRRFELYAPPPPDPEAFNTYFVLNTDGKWYSKYPPGHAALLAIVKTIFGTYRAFPPLIAFANALLMGCLARRYGGWIGCYAGYFAMALSPFFLVQNACFMSYASGIFYLLVGLLSLQRLIDTGRARWAVLLGASFGLNFNTRPFAAMLEAMPFALYYALNCAISTDTSPTSKYTIRIAWKPRMLLMGLLAVAVSAPLMSLYFFYNKALTGEYLLPPFIKYTPVERPDILWMFSLSVLQSRLRQVATMVASFDVWWFAIAIPIETLFLLALMFLRSSYALFLLILGAFLCLGYVAYPYSTGAGAWGVEFWGPVYMTELLVPSILLFSMLAVRLAPIWQTSRWKYFLALAIAFLAFKYSQNFGERFHSYAHNTRLRSDLYDRAHTKEDGKALIFLRSTVIGNPHGHLINDPFFKEDIIYALDLGRNRNIELWHKHFPDRKAYQISNTSLTRINEASFVNQWLLIGPFSDDPEILNHSEPFPHKSKPSAGDSVASLKWNSVSGEIIDLNGAFGAGQKRAAYAYTQIYSPEARDVTILMGSAACVTVWINGSQVFTEFINRYWELTPDEVRFSVSLNKGWNSVLIRIVQFDEAWGFSFKVVDPASLKDIPGVINSTVRQKDALHGENGQ